MDKKISDLTISEFRTLVKRIVRKELKDYDPDERLEVKEGVVKILNTNIKERRTRKQKTVSFNKVFQK